jgi:GntR family transcriptional repressor for pyruvate dehydrogenase complex
MSAKGQSTRQALLAAAMSASGRRSDRHSGGSHGRRPAHHLGSTWPVLSSDANEVVIVVAAGIAAAGACLVAHLVSNSPAAEPARRDPGPTGSLRFQRLAELVADRLRDRILRGDLHDGEVLPKEDELRAQYPVSKPSLREAMRILEAEGLITVRRGNVGGAVIHRPTPANVAYTLSLVLSANQVSIADVADALRAVEPTCAALCAARRDRTRVVLPRLRALQKRALASVDDLVEATSLSRQFHETMVSLCGNESLIIVVGALEALWSSHERGWAHDAAATASVPVEERRAALLSHQEIIDLIAAGDGPGVRDLSAAHLAAVQSYPSSPTPGLVDPLIIRDRMP